MVVGLKDAVKLIGISAVACCAVFVCALFLHYQADLTAMEAQITGEAETAMYRAQVSTGQVVCALTGGCLALTSAVMLLFYIKNYIDSHGKPLGLLKALGYSNFRVAKHFWVFGLCVLTGCAVGYAAAYLYLPRFYRIQNAEHLFPEMAVGLRPLLAVLLVGVPAAVFMGVSVLYAWSRLRRPVLSLMKESENFGRKKRREQRDSPELPFLQELRKHSGRGRKTLVFLIAISAFSFSATTQMAFSMKKLSSEAFAGMMVTIGLVLAYVIVFLSLTSAVKAHTKTIAMMRALGYPHGACSRAVLGGYRPAALIGFALGTLYQYGLLKLMVLVIFADVGIPEYHFDFIAFAVSLAAYAVSYELILYVFSIKIKRLSLKNVMLD